MAFEISCPTCTSLGTERTIAGAMKLALAHAPQHSPVYIAGDGARFTIRHDGKPAIEVLNTPPPAHLCQGCRGRRAASLAAPCGLGNPLTRPQVYTLDERCDSC